MRLKPGGIMLVLSGQTYLPAVLYELTTDEAIRYVWTIAYDMPGGSVMANKAHAHCNWKPLILLCKGDYAGEWYSDRLTVPTPTKPRERITPMATAGSRHYRGTQKVGHARPAGVRPVRWSRHNWRGSADVGLWFYRRRH